MAEGPTSVYLPADLVQKIDKLAAKIRLSRSYVIRSLCEDGLPGFERRYNSPSKSRKRK